MDVGPYLSVVLTKSDLIDAPKAVAQVAESKELITGENDDMEKVFMFS